MTNIIDENNLIHPQVAPELLEHLDWSDILLKLRSELHLKPLHRSSLLTSMSSWDEVKESYQFLKKLRSFSHQVKNLLLDISSIDNEAILRVLSSPLVEIPDLDDLAQFTLFLDKALKSDFFHHGTYLNFDELTFSEIKRLCSFFIPSTENGKFLFHKIPGLANAQKQLESIYLQIKNELDVAVNRELEGILSNKNLIFRDSRYCVLIPAELYSKSHGKIISQSNTGRTFYVEPERFLRLNSLYSEIIDQYESVIAEYKYTTLNLLKSSQSEIKAILKLILKVDLTYAKDNFLKGTKCLPVFTNDIFKATKVTHPLLDKPVANDVLISSNNVLLSGANSSGKTVYLKSICLLYLLARNGVPLPCEEAQLPEIDFLFYPSASNQKLIKGTSSFIAEFDCLDRAFEIEGRTIFIWDEAFGNTSSASATALILSIIHAFESKEFVRFIVSTHHDQLKTFAKNLKEFELLSTDPDFKYSIIRNFTTLSNPLEAIKKMRKSSKLLLSISDQYHEYSNLTQDFLGKFYSDILSKEQSNLELIKKLQSELDSIKKEIKEAEISLIKKQELNTKASKVEMQLNPVNIEAPKLSNEDLNPNAIIEINSNYESKSLGISVKVISAHKKGYECLAKGKRIVLPADDLVGKKQIQNKVQVQFSHQKDFDYSYDLRGLRRDEFLNEAERAIGSLITGHQTQIEIVHGKGNGVLLECIRQLAKEYSELTFNFSDDMGSVIIKS